MPVVQHMAFGCKDRLEQERFYTDKLGFRRVRVFNPGTDNEFVMLRLDGVCIEFFAAKEGAENAGPQDAGFRHLAFEVDDLDAKVAEMKAAGVAMDDIIDCNAMVPGMRVCFFKDPEGNVLEFMEGWHDEAHPPAFPG